MLRPLNPRPNGRRFFPGSHAGLRTPGDMPLADAVGDVAVLDQDFGEEAVPEGRTHGHFPVGIFSVDGIQVATHCVAAKQTPSIEWGRHADIRS